MVKEIPLTSGKFALVDDVDYEYLSQWRWSYDGRYAVRKTNYYDNSGKRFTKKFYMHRELMGNPKAVDHKNLNKLDNTRANLRSCNKSLNEANKSKISVNTSSKYKGVTWHKRAGKWLAQIKKDKVFFYLGLHSSELDAAKAYNDEAVKHFGEFAYINEISA